MDSENNQSARRWRKCLFLQLKEEKHVSPWIAECDITFNVSQEMLSREYSLWMLCNWDILVQLSIWSCLFKITFRLAILEFCGVARARATPCNVILWFLWRRGWNVGIICRFLGGWETARFEIFLL